MSQPRIVDCHTHLGAPWYLFAHGWELRDVLRLMDQLGIERAYSMHHCWLAGEFAEARAASIEAYEESGARMPFLAVHDPRQETASLKVIDACLDHEGFVGIKIHPSFHGLYANDERYRSVWDYCKAHGLPLVSHTWSVTDNPIQKLSEPRLFEGYVAEYPEVPVVMAHSGGRGDGQLQAVCLAQKYPNVHLDIAGDIFCLDLIKTLVDSVGADRVLFGSDQPWVDPRANLVRVFMADVAEDAKALILGRNALRLFEPELLGEQR